MGTAARSIAVVGTQQGRDEADHRTNAHQAMQQRRIFMRMLHAEAAAAFVSARCPYHTYEHVLTTGPYVARDRRTYVTFAPTCTCTRCSSDLASLQLACRFLALCLHMCARMWPTGLIGGDSRLCW